MNTHLANSNRVVCDHSFDSIHIFIEHIWLCLVSSEKDVLTISRHFDLGSGSFRSVIVFGNPTLFIYRFAI